MIRDAHAGDLDRLLEIEAAGFDPALYPRMSRRQFRHHVKSANAVVKVCEDGGKVAGYALGLLHSRQRFLRFYSIAVDPAMQGGQVGKALFQSIEQEARRRGLGVICEVRRDNEKLRKRYADIGYVEYDEVSDYYPDGQSCLKLMKRLP